MKSRDKQPIRCTAVDWVVKQQLETFGPAQQRELEQWLSLDPAHGMALAEVERAWEISAELPSVIEVPVAHRQSPRRLFPAWLAGFRPGVAIASLVLLCGLALLMGQPVWLRMTADHYTATGEIREVQLDDGSRVTLNTRTAIAVEYSGQERHVRLLRGEALFTPAPQDVREPRPFVVETAGGLNRALGTVFLLKREDVDHGRLSVLEHSVLISLPVPDGAPRQQLLHEGQSARYRRAGEIELFDLPAGGANWARGLLSYDNRSLADVIDDLNRYSRDRLILLDRKAAGQPVTATFHLDSLDKALQVLGDQHHLRIARLPGLKLIY